MMNRKSIRNLILIWLAWSIILIGFMNIAGKRMLPDRPDDALTWTADWTTARSLNGKDYLTEPFLNTQVAWDSEYYLSIAIVGYDDPDIQTVRGEDGKEYSLSYAFFPLYPLIIKIVSIPLQIFGLNTIATATLAGVIVSLLGTLTGMIALYDITREELGEDGAIRTAFMMLIFPVSVYFSVVYTEGLFVGLAFSSLALMRRKHLITACVLAMFATWTRSVGGLLMIPLFLTWWTTDRKSLSLNTFLRLGALGLPLVAYGIFRAINGASFDVVQANWFGNGLFALDNFQTSWNQLFERASTNPETAVFVGLALASVAFTCLSILVELRRYPYIAIFGFFAVLIPMTSGWTGSNSAIRYMMAVPTLWIMLGRWSKNPVFDRAWTIFGILTLALLSYMLSFDLWVA